MHKCAWNTKHTQGMETFAKLCSLLRKTETLRNCDCKDGDFRWNLSHLVLYYASTQILIKREQSPKLNKQLDGNLKDAVILLLLRLVYTIRYWKGKYLLLLWKLNKRSPKT